MKEDLWNKDYRAESIRREYDRKLLANDVLSDIVKGKTPNIAILRQLYGEGNLHHFVNKIENFMEENIQPYLNSGMDVRPLYNIEESELYIKKNQAHDMAFYKYAVSKLNPDEKIKKWGLLDKHQLDDFFLQYSDLAQKNLEMFQHLKKIRKCELPYVFHLIRCSTMAKAIGFDINSGKPDNYYTSLWFFHDSIEELLSSIHDSKGKIKYGLDSIPEFLNDFIPSEMHADIMMVSNKSDIILEHLYSHNYSMKSKHEMNMSLSSLLKRQKYSMVHETVAKMKDMLNSVEFDADPENFYKDAKWEFYKRLFIGDLAEQAYKKDHLALFEGKGVVDLFDNCVAVEAREPKDKRRSILKLKAWADKAEEIVLRAGTAGKKYPFFEGKILEGMNYANYAAWKLMVDFMAKDIIRSDHLDVTFISLNDLKPVLYTKKSEH
jgi:hypothetical protein